MDDRIELLLEVDSLAEAIGGDEDASLAAGKFGDFLLALVITDVASHRLDMQAEEFPAEELLKVPGNIVGRWDESAKDDRPKAALEQIPHDLGEAREFAIFFRPGKRVGSVAKDFEPATVVIDADAFRLVHRSGRRVIGQLLFAE